MILLFSVEKIETIEGGVLMVEQIASVRSDGKW